MLRLPQEYIPPSAELYPARAAPVLSRGLATVTGQYERDRERDLNYDDAMSHEQVCMHVHPIGVCGEQ